MLYRNKMIYYKYYYTYLGIVILHYYFKLVHNSDQNDDPLLKYVHK